MSIYNMLQQITAGEVAGWAIVGLILILSFIEISPIKLNPWEKILGWFGKKANGDLRDQMKDLQKQVCDLWINAHRQSILGFARELRAGVEHDTEEWTHILSVADEYEHYCAKHEVSNGVVKADTAFIKELYLELSREHKI